MITKTQIKKLDNKGIVPFTVKSDITTPLLDCDRSKVGMKKTFFSGGKNYGELVYAVVGIQDESGKMNLADKGAALLIKDPENGGHYLIKAENATPWNDTDTSSADGSENTDSKQETSPVIEHLVSEANSKLNSPKTYFGFTTKQLLIVGVLLLIVKKL